jgi:hypothetical protein
MTHRASLDVPAATLKAVTAWVARHRRRRGARPAQRAAAVHAQVLLVLRWLRQRADLRTLAQDAGKGRAGSNITHIYGLKRSLRGRAGFQDSRA